MDFLETPLKEFGRWHDLPKIDCSWEDYMRAIAVPSYKPHEMVRPRLKVGIEVEVEQVRDRLLPNVANAVWGVREDGSLRNGGVEFVSIPICDQQIPWSIHYLFDQYLPKQADFSDRTSIHVHVNVRSWSCGDVLNLMLLYIVFEKLLYRFAGPHRYKNIFCVPIQETKLPIVLSNYLANGAFDDLLMHWAKYSGLNLVPIKKMGTVEYRQMLGHRDSDYLLNWINILQQMHKAADTTNFKQLFNTIKTLNSTSYYEQFLVDTFKDQAKHLLKFDLKREMEYGVSVVKAIQPPSAFLKRILGSISNKSALLQGLHLVEAQTKKEKMLYDVHFAGGQIPVGAPAGWNINEFNIQRANVEMPGGHYQFRPDGNMEWIPN